MPALDLSVLQSLRDDYRNYPIFVETGTYMGETIFAMEPFFHTLHTTEIKREFFNHVRRINTSSKIQFHHGDSAVLFPSLLPTLRGNAIFFLDGHWSAEDTGRGVKDVPLVEELTAIRNNYPHAAIVIIDDHRLFGKGPSTGTEVVNWEAINDAAILDAVGSRLAQHYFLPSALDARDRMVLHINPE